MDFKKIGSDVVTSGLSSLGNTVTDIFGDMFAGLFGRSENQKYQKQLNMQKAYQKEMIDYQNEKTREQTQYMYDNFTSPQAIMSSYQKAGLNPNLVAGSISGAPSALSSASGNSGSATYQSNAKGYNPLLRAQLEASEMQSQYQTEQIEYQKLKNEEQDLLNKKLRAESGNWKAISDATLESILKGNEKSQAEIDNYRQAINESCARINSMKIADAKVIQEINNLFTQDRFIKASIAEKWQQIKHLKSQTAVGWATVALVNTQTEGQKILNGLNSQQTEKLAKELQGVDSENKLKEAQAKLAQYDADQPEWLQAVSYVCRTLGQILGGSISATAGN